MKRQLIFFGFVGVPAVALFVVVLTLVMAVALEGDVEILSRQAHAAARAERNLRADMEAIKGDLAALSDESAAAPTAAAQPAAASGRARQGALVLTHAPYAIDSPRPLKLNAAAAPEAAPPECVFRQGDAERLADCIRGQQDRIGRSRGPSVYR